MENFPFGQPVQKVEQKDRSPKKVFILGVYASAVHAKWISTQGKTLINAIAVASEPYIFWRGDGAQEIISKIKLPKEAGELIPANNNFNGPSGMTLDDKFLGPLSLTRKDCWLCDLVPYGMLNSSQISALQRNEYLFDKIRLKRHNMKIADLKNRKIDEIRRKEIVSEIKKSKAKYLITLGNEPIKNFIKYYDPKINLLNEQSYGQIKEITLDSLSIKHLALVHPRQAGRLGSHSSQWYEIHSNWILNNAKNLDLNK
jgi:hypothetical protein